MTRSKNMRVIIAFIMAAIMMMPAAVVSAGSGPTNAPDMPKHGSGPAMGPTQGTGPAVPPPIPLAGPRVNPRAIPHTSVIENSTALGAGIPAQSLEADVADGGKNQSAVGRGIKQTATGVGAGLTLYDSPNVCNTFDRFGSYAVPNGKSDLWTDWYAGWAPFAINNGYYQAKNVTFTMERVVGPGNSYNDTLSADNREENSVKIASHQPYAAGFGSPIIPVPAGYESGKVMVSVKYLIWDHDQGGKFGGPDGLDYDWASMGIKPGAAGDTAVYVNGYVRGEWAELTHTIDLGGARDIMVLIQAHSPGALNSNIYFDDVKIAFIDANGEGKYLRDCTTAEAVQ